MTNAYERGRRDTQAKAEPAPPKGPNVGPRDENIVAYIVGYGDGRDGLRPRAHTPALELTQPEYLRGYADGKNGHPSRLDVKVRSPEPDTGTRFALLEVD